MDNLRVKKLAAFFCFFFVDKQNFHYYVKKRVCPRIGVNHRSGAGKNMKTYDQQKKITISPTGDKCFLFTKHHKLGTLASG